MKTRRLVTMASILAIAIMSVSISQVVNAAEDKKNRTARKVAYLTFDQAVQNAGILHEMYKQIEDDMLPTNRPDYTARILYKDIIIYIHGSYEQWCKFFRDQIKYMKNRQQ
jgi:hypothetical protein